MTFFREHYHRVVRAFYSEAQELTEFLSKISCANNTLRSMQSHVEDEEIDELSRNQWSQACGQNLDDNLYHITYMSTLVNLSSKICFFY